jgi:pimeloyl-ACP methyl ester carboxylesterase
MHALFLLFFALLVFVPPAQTGALPRFEPAPCPRSFSGDVECGYLTVPEDRENPESPTIRIAVAIFHATGNNPASDPLLFLDGGPGSRTLDAWSGGIDPLIARIGRDHDVIVFDQRGMGYSEPALTCPEQFEEDAADWLTRCHDRLVGEGINLAAYTTRENASDAADLIKALGIESYNVWGGSYGSSLALALLRDHPEGIRSVVVTALQPPQGDLQASLGPMFQRTIDLIAEQCAADAACSAAFPGSMGEKLAAVVAQLDETPIQLDVQGQSETLDGSAIISGLGQLLKDQPTLSNTPALVEALYYQQYDFVLPYAQALAAQPDTSNPVGAYYSMRCSDSILATTPEQLETSLAAIDPAFRDHFRARTQTQVEECQTWGAHVPTEPELAPAVSDVPVLIMNGEFDPYSSPEWVESTLATLPNGHAFWFTGYAHGINTDVCAQRIFHDFITDPSQTPDATCIENIPQLHFQIP